MTIRSTGEHAYFAASNSTSGFFSYYAEIFDAARIKHVYAIKGGPGTGKNRFLRTVADAASEHRMACEYIYCSSDPTSLDAVILTDGNGESIALLDATAPHVYEPRLPGAREEIINLGDFWNAEQLGEHLEEIDALNRQKSDAYRRAYRFLAGFGEMSRNRDSLVSPAVKTEKLRAFAARLMQGIPDGRQFSAAPALIHSVGMRGEVGFDTYFAEAHKLYLIEDCRGTASILLAELGNLARDKRLSVRISHDPVEAEKIDGIFLRESGTAFAVCRADACAYPYRKIGMRRFVDIARLRPVRAELNHTERMRRAMREGALDALEKVRVLHFRLEEIYSAAMDFERKEAFTQAFCQRLFEKDETKGTI